MRVGEVYNVKYNPNQRWYWIGDQTEDEVSVFVSWDSEDKGGKTSFPQGQDI
jgi:hypothetical protein